MGRLIYSGIISLDGYLTDENRNFDWGAPDEEVHAYINDRQRPIGTYLFGRRMYETMKAWDDLAATDSPAMDDFAGIWRTADKVVYSTTLRQAVTARTRIESRFDPDAVRAFVAGSGSDVSIGGAGLAALALEAGLVDDIELYLAPVIVGGGTRFFPDGLKLGLELIAERRFASGFTYVAYRTT